MLQNALSAGLLSCGSQRHRSGRDPDLAVSWLVGQLNAEAGVVISASHTPS